MPKRECPFEDNLLPQLKVHVGQKEISNGVNKIREMSKIYEKTLSLLKNGSKEFEQKLSLYQKEANKMESSTMDSQPAEQKSSSALRQMIFDDKLTLRASEKDVDICAPESCKACATTALSAFTRCFYCNNFKCSDCLKDCTKCEEYFCDKCSLVVYEGEEHTECLACYR